ncbi:myb-binding protein 1A-like protein [Anguilla anguilla]|uniref:myb-binding protein 1A-like protein n=1 Tax=Anguilla anguilla TaxID=7936 RepID=UPI0015AD9489|nr:myb-binding protein 1A-like protein [Anguilla anguilla]
MATATHADMGEIEKEPLRPKVTDAKGILKQNREFLDFFWDIAKPEQEIRLKAIENLIQYLKKSEKSDERTYTLKRLVDGLSHTREAARPGFSLALAQVLSVFEDIQLQSTLGYIKEKHDLQKVKKKLIRNAAFGNFFGVLALSQSGRLSKEPPVLLECVQLLQSLAQYREHLKDLPRKTMVDILSETTEEVFEEALLGALQSDLSAAFSTPEQLQLLLVAMQRFPGVLKPKKLKKLLGSATVVTQENIPKLVEVLKMAGRSVKKDRLLPAVALDLLQVALKEDSFELFWREAVVKGLLTEQSGPNNFMCYRLLGSALPLLSLPQLQQVLSGEVMKHYGEHVVSAQLPDRFKFAPEMETYVGDFLQGCSDPERQLAVTLGFTKLTNQGYPVVPSFWRVVQYLEPTVLRRYVDWLKGMFSHPQLESCLDFSTRRQQENQEAGVQNEHRVFRLRRWIIPRLTSIVENQQVKKDEDLVMEVARFVFFHTFFVAKKSTPDIPETETIPSVPVDEKTRSVIANSFFGLLQHLNHRPVQGDAPEAPAQNEKRAQGAMADGTLWIYRLVQYADVLLRQAKHVQCAQPFTPQQRQSWDSMLTSVEALQKKAKKAQTEETAAFQQLFLLVGIYLFRAAEESVDLMQDLQNCLEKAQAKKAKKKKKKATGTEEEAEEAEPQWAEVMVDILLSLLSQPSRFVRQVCRTVFAGICPHVTQRALGAILDVLDPHKDEEDSSVMVTDEKDEGKKRKRGQREEDEEDDQEEDEEEMESSDQDSDDDDNEEEDDKDDEALEEDEDAEEEEEVDQNFRLELMKVLQGQGALATEGDDSEDDELDDETMMKLDGSISALFAEQKKRIQAKKDEKERFRKEKALVRDFKIKVLDLVEVFLSKQSDSPLVLGIVEPLLSIIESGMSSETNQQEQDFLRKTADIFRNQLCRAKRYCKNVAGMQEDLHDMLERVLTRAQRLSDSSVSLYFFSASLYLVKVLRGSVSNAAAGKEEEGGEESSTALQGADMGGVDVERVTGLFKGALRSFMTRRKSALSGAMFIDLFTRFPVLCVRLLDSAVEYITEGVRQHQQGQACAIVLRGLQTKEVRQLMTDAQWAELCEKTVGQLAETLSSITGYKIKVVHEKVVKALELSQFLVRNIQQQKLSVNLEPLKEVLLPMNQLEGFRKTGQLEDTYWGVMKHFGILKPKVEKAKKSAEEQAQQSAPKKKKKGFLPETKKRKNRKKQAPLEGKEPGQAPAPPPGAAHAAGEAGAGQAGKKKNKKNRNKKRKQQEQDGGKEPGQAAAKKAKTQPPAKPKKKNKKQQQGGDT